MDLLQSPDSYDDHDPTSTTEASELSTPATFSLNGSPVLQDTSLPEDNASAATIKKKKKKKKSKKSAAAKAKEKEVEAASARKAKVEDADDDDDDDGPQVLCISRNKHWRYISSYHGPWLQLPTELLQTLFTLNIDPRIPPNPTRLRTYPNLDDYSPSQSPRSLATPLIPEKAAPPPIDPGVLGSVLAIRKLIDEASELSVRASSGLSAVELGSMRSASVYNGSSIAAAQSLGLNPMGNTSGGGRPNNMSGARVHKLRSLAVNKLAEAYKADEIASSVMVMQGGSVFDDIAERVLKYDPHDANAKYVHFFHEKIPSSHRQLAESTTTKVLDELIAEFPHRLEYYRTRGIVQCFRDEYAQATKDFTFALKEARARRKIKTMHHQNHGSASDSRRPKGKKRKGAVGHTSPPPPSANTELMDYIFEKRPLLFKGPDGEPVPLHFSGTPEAPEPIEVQLLFLRGAAYLQHAVYLIENACLELEQVQKVPTPEGAELRLCYLENARYGGVEIGNPDGPLGSSKGEKLKAYRKTLVTPAFKEQVSSLLKKSIRDHEKFLSHFGIGETNKGYRDSDIAEQVEYAFLLTEAVRPGNHNNPPPPPPPPPQPQPQPTSKLLSDSSTTSTSIPTPSTPTSTPTAPVTSYHPLIVESHFSLMICQLMLADFINLISTFARTSTLVDGAEGYPVFLPPRSMGQAEFMEVLERLALGWRNGILPHSLSNKRGKAKHATIDSDGGGVIGAGLGPYGLGIGIGGGNGPYGGLGNDFFSAAKAVFQLSTFPANYIPSSKSPTSTPGLGLGSGSTSTTSMMNLDSPGLLTPSSSSTSTTSTITASTSLSTSASASATLTNNMAGININNHNPNPNPPSSSSSSSSSSYVLPPPTPTPSSSTSYQHQNHNQSQSQTTITKREVEAGAEERTYRPDAAEALDCARIILAPVYKRQRERAEQAYADKLAGNKKRPTPINIPLHGPRVEIILAWVGAVHLPELDGV